MARKWQKLVTIRRKRITFRRTIGSTNTSSCSTSAKAEKGCFVVQSGDQNRFLLPLEYLNNEAIKELINMAEEEFGLPTNGTLTLPCDSEAMEYVIALIKRRVNGDAERALLTSISSCSSNLLPFHPHHQLISHQSAIYSF